MFSIDNMENMPEKRKLGFFGDFLRKLGSYFTLKFRQEKVRYREKIVEQKKERPFLVKLKSSYNRKTFEVPDFKYSFETIHKACITDSFLTRAINVYLELFFKEGWTFSSLDDDVQKYVETRSKLLTETTGKPFNILLIEIASDLIKYHNAFLIKVRDDIINLRLKKKLYSVNGKDPVAAYYRINPQYVSIQKDVTGRGLIYRIAIPGTEERDYKADDVIHFYVQKEQGSAFGTPFLLSVIDDIEALREMESNIIKLVQRHLFPFLQYQVGLPQPGLEAREGELEVVKKNIEENPVDAVIVVPERHTIKSVGAQGEALNIQDYINHFTQRIMFALGFTAARATEISIETASKSLYDKIRAYQAVISIFVNEFIIKEWLLENKIDIINDPTKEVSLVFNEIDIDLKIKKENQSIYMYEHYITTQAETRRALNLDLLTPDAEKDLYLYKVKIPLAVQTGLARLGVMPGSEPEGSPETDNKVSPQNQYTGNKEEIISAFLNAKSYKELESVLNKLLNTLSTESKEKIISLAQKMFSIIEDDRYSHLKKTIREFYIGQLPF